MRLRLRCGGVRWRHGYNCRRGLRLILERDDLRFECGYRALRSCMVCMDSSTAESSWFERVVNPSKRRSMTGEAVNLINDVVIPAEDGTFSRPSLQASSASPLQHCISSLHPVVLCCCVFCLAIYSSFSSSILSSSWAQSSEYSSHPSPPPNPPSLSSHSYYPLKRSHHVDVIDEWGRLPHDACFAN